jgi:hypothetical protein
MYRAPRLVHRLVEVRVGEVIDKLEDKGVAGIIIITDMGGQGADQDKDKDRGRA